MSKVRKYLPLLLSFCGGVGTSMLFNESTVLKLELPGERDEGNRKKWKFVLGPTEMLINLASEAKD